MKKSLASLAVFASLLPALAVEPAAAQDAPAHIAKPMTPAERGEHFLNDSVDREYKLKYVVSAQDANEILTSIRNMVEPQTKVFLVPSTEMIAVHAPEEVQAQIAKLLTALDLPHLRYRLTYTVTELDGNRKVGVQHFSMVVISGQRTQVKQGSRIPLLTAGIKPGDPVPAYTYIDVGMNFDTNFTETEGGGVLRTKVEQSSVAPDSMAANGGNPVIRQTFFEGVASLVDRKPLIIGSVDVPSSTHHFEIEVLLEPMS